MEEIRLDRLSLGELEREIEKYQRKYGMSFDEFMKSYDDDEAKPDTALDQIVWETLEEAKAARIRSGRIDVKVSEERPVVVFTPKRVEILRALSKKSPATVRELAKLTGRPEKAVYNDVRLLQAHGFVKLEGGRGRKTVSLLVREVLIRI